MNLPRTTMIRVEYSGNREQCFDACWLAKLNNKDLSALSKLLMRKECTVTKGWRELVWKIALKRNY